MINKLIKLNNARFGSFGEYVFEQQNLSKNIRRKHCNRTDFIWNKVSYDIKSKRIFNQYYRNPHKYAGNKVDGIEYILVEFYKDIVVISNNKIVLKTINYQVITELFKKWMKNKSIKNQSKKDLYELNQIIERISNFFNSKGLKTKIIYRTSQNLFGAESPNNLMPKTFSKNSVTVFLNFFSSILIEKNLKEIIVFKDYFAKKFKLIDKPRLHQNKIDLLKIGSEYRFKDVDDILIGA